MSAETLEYHGTSGYANRPSDQYLHFVAHEGTQSQSLVALCRRIHAESYRLAGFINEAAINPETGFVVDDLDKSTGASTEYLLGLHAGGNNSAVTMRKCHLGPTDDYTALPSYRMVAGSLSAPGLEELQSIGCQGTRLKEIAALGRSQNATPQALNELLRNAIQESLGRKEVWFFSMVTGTYDYIARVLGRDNLLTLGADVPLVDPRVMPGILLRPALSHIDNVLENLLDDYEKARSDVERHRLRKSFLYFTEGLGRDKAGDRVYEAMQLLSTGHTEG